LRPANKTLKAQNGGLGGHQRPTIMFSPGAERTTFDLDSCGKLRNHVAGFSPFKWRLFPYQVHQQWPL